MRKTKKILFAVLIIALVSIGVSFLPTYIDLNDEHDNVAKAFKQTTGLEMSQVKRIRLRLALSPKIIIDRVKVKDKQTGKNIFIRKIIANVSLLPLIVKNINISEIILYDARFRLSQLTKFYGENLNTIPVELQNSAIIIDNGNTKPFVIENVNSKIKVSGIGDDSLQLLTDFMLSNEKYTLNADFNSIDSNGNSDNSSFALKGDNLSVSFEGKLYDIFNDLKLDGKISTSVFIGEQDEGRKEIVLGANFIYNDDKINLTDGVINSSIISEGKFDVVLRYAKSREMDINVSIQEVDLKDTQLKLEVDSFKSIGKVLNNIFDSFNIGQLPSNLSSVASVNIAKIQMKNGSIDNLKMDADMFAGIISINSLSFSGEGDAKFNLSGLLTHNKIRPKFDGNFVFKTDDFSKFAGFLSTESKVKKVQIKSDMSLIPRSFIFDKIRGVMDKDIFRGKMLFKQNTGSKIASDVLLEFKKIDMDSDKQSDIVNKFIFDLFRSDIDKTGEVYRSVTNDFSWLRKMDIDLKLHIKSPRLIFAGKEFKNFDLNTKVSRNRVDIYNFGLSSKPISFSISGDLSLPKFRPILNLDLDFKRLDLAALGDVLPRYDSMLYTMKKNSGNKFISDFNFFGMHNHDGEIKVKASKFKYGKVYIRDLLFTSKVDNGIWTIDKFESKSFGGKAKASGYVIVNSQVPQFSMSFSLNNIHVEKLLGQTYGYENVKGYMSLSGSLRTQGITYKDFYSNMSGKSELLGKKITWKGYNLYDITTLPGVKMKLDDKLKAIDYYSSSGETTFSDLKGQIAIKNGIASLNNITLNNDRASAAYVGSFNIIGKSLANILRLSFIPYGSKKPISIFVKSKGQVSKLAVEFDNNELVRLLRREDQKLKRGLLKDKTTSILRNKRT